jgi:hypothetical protein
MKTKPKVIKMGEAKLSKGEWFEWYPHELLNHDGAVETVSRHRHNLKRDLSGYVCVETACGREIYTKSTSNRTISEDVANANLIAAAPEMYEMLTSLREDFGFNHPVGIEIDELLAKARGE